MSAAAIVDAMREMDRRGLNVGTSGNVSVRSAQGMLITPSGVPADELIPAQIVHLLHGSPAGAPRLAFPDQLSPSSEWHFHAAIYQERADVQAVVHCHSRYATALACTRRGIPAFHYLVAAAGGSEIPLADYALFGTAALAAAVVDALGEGYQACLLANHGQVAVGDSLAAALQGAELVETLAAQYWSTLAIGGPLLLSDAEMDAVQRQFVGYGKQ